MIDEMTTIQEACNIVCRDLPDGWRIEIELERDSGNVELIDQYGENTPFPSNCESIFEALSDALEFAQDVERKKK